ncbi:hypothetical protein Q1695_004037 [Nippostrongylus brasiliensis]|nr:hypothetical protein Q1695_004037 [Nippostrongylus brasiliensis]
MVSSTGCDENGKQVEDVRQGTSVLQIPEAVRGMRELQKDAFSINVHFPTMKVDATSVSVIQRKVRLEKYLIRNLGRIKSIMNADDVKSKLYVFDPNIMKEDSEELKSHIETMVKEHAPDAKLHWDSTTLQVTFEDWDLRKILKAVLPSDLDFSSYSQAGHIVHVNLRDNLLPYKTLIGQILLEKVGKCRTVVNKIDGITSEYRNFELDLLAGEDNYVTETIEGGIRYQLDFSKVFWNSRLSHEHERLLKFFDSRSLVYDACAGIGPFVLPAIKKGRAAHVLANDLNPESVRWLKQNATLNKIPTEKLDVYNLDANEFIRGPMAKHLSQEIEKAETSENPPSGAHVVMNLPAYAVNFLPSLRGVLSNSLPAGISPKFAVKVYCYLFAKAHEDVPEKWYEDKAIQMVREFLSENDASVDLVHHVRTVSSRKEMFCVQLTLSNACMIEKASEDRPAKRAHSNGSDDHGQEKREKLSE